MRGIGFAIVLFGGEKGVGAVWIWLVRVGPMGLELERGQKGVLFDGDERVVMKINERCVWYGKLRT